MLSSSWRNAILSNSNGIAMEMPMIVLHGKDPDALLKSAYTLVERSSRTTTNAKNADGWGPKEQEDVSLPRLEWGSGRRVVVDRRYHFVTGALMVKVPDPTISNASISTEEEGEVLHAGAAHVARCAGVMEVVKEFSSSWCVDMKRRIIILHLACRLPKHHQGALRKIAEDSHASTLVVLTALRPLSLDHGIFSRGVYVPIPGLLPLPPLANAKGFYPMGLLTKMLESSSSSSMTLVNSCADIDLAVSHIRALGGDIVAARNVGIKVLNEIYKKFKKQQQQQQTKPAAA